MAKNLILDLILAYLAQIWAPNFFLQVLPVLVVKHCSKLSLYAISRETNESKKLVSHPILIHLS